jgi:hypothetical protein
VAGSRRASGAVGVARGFEQNASGQYPTAIEGDT